MTSTSGEVEDPENENQSQNGGSTSGNGGTDRVGSYLLHGVLKREGVSK